MYGRLITENLHMVRAVWPVNLATGANAGDYISLKHYPIGGVLIPIGASAGTADVTMLQARNVAALGEKALPFTEQWQTGCRLNITGKTGTFQTGETLSGAGGGSGVVYRDCGTYVLLRTVNATPFVDGELVTGGTTSYTANASGIGIDEDMLLPVAVAANTFTIPAVANRTYVIPFEAMMLDVANDFSCLRVHIAQATGATIGAAYYLLDPSEKGRPMLTAIYD